MKRQILFATAITLSFCFAGPAIADVVEIGSQSGNTIEDEVLAYGWIRSDQPDRTAGGETAFIGTAGTQDFRAYVAFDLSGFSIGDTINSATVSLWSEGADTFDANGPSVTDAVSIGLNLTAITEVTGYGDGFGNNAVLDSDGTTPASFTNLAGLYGGVLDTVTLNLDTIAVDTKVDFDAAAEIQTAVNAGASKITFGFTSPDAIATGARNFFGFEGLDQSADGTGTIGPNLSIDFTPSAIPEPGSLTILILGSAFCFAKRRRRLVS